MMRAFMAMNMEAKQRGLQFSDRDKSDRFHPHLRHGAGGEEKLDILKMLSKMAGPR